MSARAAPAAPSTTNIERQTDHGLRRFFMMTPMPGRRGGRLYSTADPPETARVSRRLLQEVLPDERDQHVEQVVGVALLDEAVALVAGHQVPDGRSLLTQRADHLLGFEQ